MERLHICVNERWRLIVITIVVRQSAVLTETRHTHTHTPLVMHTGARTVYQAIFVKYNETITVSHNSKLDRPSLLAGRSQHRTRSKRAHAHSNKYADRQSVRATRRWVRDTHTKCTEKNLFARSSVRCRLILWADSATAATQHVLARIVT